MLRVRLGGEGRAGRTVWSIVTKGFEEQTA